VTIFRATLEGTREETPSEVFLGGVVVVVAATEPNPGTATGPAMGKVGGAAVVEMSPGVYLDCDGAAPSSGEWS
jgi:hypothetical protein